LMTQRGLWPTVLASLVGLVVVAGCSTPKPTQPSTISSVTPTTTSAPPQSHGVYEQCLTEHGVPAPPAGPAPGPEPVPQGPPPGPAPEGTPGAVPPPPPGVDETTWAKATQACASLQPRPPAGNP
jgi:hypothetical protein